MVRSKVSSVRELGSITQPSKRAPLAAHLLLLACAVAQPQSALAQDYRGLTLDLGLFGGLPSALNTGQLLGPSLGGAWRTGFGFHFGGQVQLGFASGATDTHQLHHTEARVQLTAGAGVQLKDALLGLELGVGGLLVHERRTRHQARRLEALGLTDDLRATGWSLGPIVSLDGVLRLFILHGWGVALRAGPTVGWSRVLEERRSRIGWAGSVALVHHLGDVL